jgi:hypothetical protein
LKKVVEHSLPGSEMGSPHWMPSPQLEHGLRVGEGVGVLDAVTSHGDGVGVLDGDAPRDFERVTEALTLAVALREAVAVPVGEGEAWHERLALLDAVTDATCNFICWVDARGGGRERGGEREEHVGLALASAGSAVCMRALLPGTYIK